MKAYEYTIAGQRWGDSDAELKIVRESSCFSSFKMDLIKGGVDPNAVFAYLGEKVVRLATR